MRPDKAFAEEHGIPNWLRRHAARYHVGVAEIAQTHKKYPVETLDHWRDRARAEGGSRL